MSEPFFPVLAGINAPREITKREDTALEKLVKIGDAVISDCPKGWGESEAKKHYETYHKLTQQLTLTLPP